MADQWIPPSKRNPLQVDLAGLGVPPGRYAIPMPGDFLIADGTPEGAARIQKHFEGTLTLSELEPDEVAFLKEHFGEQAAAQRERAMQDYTRRVPRRYLAALPNAASTAWAQAVVADPENTRSLLIVGPTGTGKTHVAYSLLRALAETGTATGWQAFTAADFYAHLRPRAGRDSEAEFESIAKARVLLLDDLGAAKLTEWTEEVTYRLVNYRYEQCLPGVFTSNVPPAQLRDVLGERIASRLTEMCERIVLKGDDRRKAMAA